MKQLNKNLRILNPITATVCFILLTCICGTFFGIGAWLFSPMKQPVTYEVQGTITSMWGTSSIKGSGTSIFVIIDGIKYEAKDGARSALSKKNIDFNEKKGDFAVLSIEVKTKEIRTLTIEGVSYLTIEEYIKGEQSIRFNYAVFVTVLGTVFTALTALLAVSVVIEKRKRKLRNDKQMKQDI